MLLSENDMGIGYKISMVFVYAFEFFVLMDYCERLFERKITKGKIYAIAIPLYIVLYAIFFLFNVNEIINTLAFSVINLLIIYLCFNVKIYTAIFHTVMLVVFMGISENVVIYAESAVFNDSTYYHLESFWYFFCLATISKFLYFVCARIMSSIIKEDESVKGSHWILFMMPLSSVFCAILIHYLSGYVIDNKTIIILCFVSVLLLFAANIIIFRIYSKSSKTAAELYELKAIEQKQEIDNTYMSIIEANNNDLKVFCHDIKNHLEQISNLSDDPKIKEYVNNLYGTVNEYSYTGMSDNKVLDIIISKYNSLCQSKRMKISFDTKTANLDFMEDVDLANVMNNLLDNAVEAAEKSSEKRISVSVYSKNNTMQIIKIINSCDTAPKVSNHKLLTSKKNKSLHGLGLTSVKNTLKKYDAILDWNYDEVNKSFETTIVFSI